MNEKYLKLQALDELGREEWVVVYKHSPTCGISRRAEGEVMQYVLDAEAVPVYKIDVLRQRPLSRKFAERYGIRHESPQAILMHRGEPLWSGSHFNITAGALAREVAAARADSLD